MPRRNPSLALSVLLSAAAPAVPGEIAFDRAEFNVLAKVITVSSTSDAATFEAAIAALEDDANWALYYRGSRYRVESARTNKAQRVIRLEYDLQSLTMPSIEDLEVGDLVLEFRVAGTPVVVVKNQARSGASSGLKFTGSKKDADIDLSGGIQAGAKVKPQYFWTARATYPFALRPGFGHIDPTFEGQASQQRNADPDSLKAGVVYQNRWPVAKRGGLGLRADLLGYEFERSIKNESVLVDGEIVSREFLEKNSNLVWSGLARWVYGWKPLNFGLGFAGVEAGKAVTRTIKTDSRGEEESTVARLRFDADVYRDFFSPSGKRILSLDGHYTLRLPLIAEPFQEAGVNGDEPFLTKKPRHWVNVNVGLLLREGVGLAVQYNYGSLPPSFEFVDHQVTVGFELLLMKK